jgi:hypothetical protein
MAWRFSVLMRCGGALPVLYGLACPAWSAESLAVAAGPATAAGSTVAAGLAVAARPATVPSAGEPRYDFDIDPMPLAQALEQFAAASGRSALFPGTLIAGRQAAAVHGRYTAAQALGRLLAGTGLQVEEIQSGTLAALVLKPAESAPAPVSHDSAMGDDDLDGYQALIQAGVWRALCADSHIAQDSYRSLLRFEVDRGGQLRQPRLISSTGNARRDAALLAALGQVRLDRSPPPRLRQPVTMLIVPPQAGGPVCPDERRLP